MSSLSQPYYTVEFIYSIVPHTYTICGRIYMQINYLPVGGAVGVNKLTARKVYLLFIFNIVRWWSGREQSSLK